MSIRWLSVGVFLTSGNAAGTLAAGDAARGEVIFKKCYACHSTAPGEIGLTGPDLSGAVRRAVASARYFNALKGLSMQGCGEWAEAALDAFIRWPQDLASGMTMTFVGMPAPRERAGRLAYAARTGAGEE